MRKEMKFTESEYAVNPLYRKMRERFSVEGQVTIGDFMRLRARRDGYEVAERTVAMQSAAPALAVPTPATAVATAGTTPREKKAPSRGVAFLRRHLTFFACFALFVAIALTLSVMIPVWTNLSASAGSDGLESAEAPAPRGEVAEAVNPEAIVYDPSFENVMNAFGE